MRLLFLECVCGCGVLLKIEKYNYNSDKVFLMMDKRHRDGMWQRMKLAWRYIILDEFPYNNIIIKEKDFDDMLDSMKGKDAKEDDK